MDAVLFDINGVIVDSEKYWVEREREEILPAVVPHEDVPVGEVTGMNYLETYEYLESEYGAQLPREEYVEVFHDAADEIYAKQVALFPGFYDVLEELADRGVAVGLVSSSPRGLIDVVIERFSLEDAFDVVVSVEEIDGPGKPAPDVYEHASERLGVAIERCVAVEDSEHGVEAAVRAGAETIAYRIDAHDDPDYSRADAVVDSPVALREAIVECLE